MVGKTLSHYEIVEKLGRGGMGDVYAAQDTKLGRVVALKVLPPEMASSSERRERFQREAKALAALDHPNIVTVHSVEEADGVHFITMERVQGKTLVSFCRKRVLGWIGSSLLPYPWPMLWAPRIGRESRTGT